MGKYSNLGNFLREQKTSAIPMTFADVERVIGHRLPRSARYPAWWSNNPSNNVMTKVWLEAGFKTEQVDTEEKKLVFRKTGAPTAEKKTERHHREPAGMAKTTNAFSGAEGNEQSHKCHHPLYGALKGYIRIMPGVDLTEPADPEWGERIWGDDTK